MAIKKAATSVLESIAPAAGSTKRAYILERLENLVWTHESLLFEYSLSAKINLGKTLRFVVANPEHISEGKYLDYTPVRIRETGRRQANGSEFTPFFGFVEKTESLYDNSRGLALEVTCRDGFQEMIDREAIEVGAFPATSYTLRSDLVKALVTNNTFQELSGGGTHEYRITTSGVEDSKATWNSTLSLDEESMSVAEAIRRVAAEDPWDSPAQAERKGFDFYLEHESERNPQQLVYFERGSKPSIPVDVNGLSLSFGVVPEARRNQEKQILPDYKFDVDPIDAITEVLVRWTDIAPEDGFPILGQTTVTDTDLEDLIRRKKTKTIDRPEIRASVEATDVGEALLERLARTTVVHADVGFVDMPRIFKSNDSVLIQPGHMVHFRNLPKRLRKRLVDDAGAPLEGSFGLNLLCIEWEFNWPSRMTSMALLGATEGGPNWMRADIIQVIGDQSEKTKGALRPSFTRTGDIVPPVTTINAIATSVTVTAEGHSYITFDVTVNFVSDVAFYELQYRKTGSTNFSRATVEQPTSGNPVIRTAPVEPNVSYDFKVQTISRTGVHSAFSTITTSTSSQDTTAPGDTSALAISAAYRTLTLEWSNPTDGDFRHTEITRSNTNDRSLGAVIALTNSEFFVDDIGLSTTRYYWLRAIDYTGNASGFQPVSSTAGVVGTTLSIVAADIADDSLTSALMKVGVQAYNTDINFTTPAWDQVSWIAATIDFADSSNAVIAATWNDGGSDTAVPYTIASDSAHYFYWLQGQTAVQISTTYSNVLGDDRALLAVIVRPPSGDDPTTQFPFVHVFQGLGEAIHSGVVSTNAVIARHIQADTITADKIKIGVQSWDSTVAFSPLTANKQQHVSWVAGTVVMSDGETFSIATNANGTGSSGLNLTAALTKYLYIDKDVSSTVLQGTTSASTAMGDQKILIAVVTPTTDSVGGFNSEDVAITIQNASGTLINSGGITTNAIRSVSIQADAIVADKINAGAVEADKLSTELVISTKIVTSANVGEGGGPAGIKISSAGIQGFSGGATETFKLDPANGNLTAAGGNVLINASGLTVTTNATITAGIIRSVASGSRVEMDSTGLKLYSGATIKIELLNGGVQRIFGIVSTLFWSTGGTDRGTILLGPSSNFVVSSLSTYDLDLQASGTGTDIILRTTSTGIVKPIGTSTDIGNSTDYFDHVWFQEGHIQNIGARSGTIVTMLDNLDIATQYLAFQERGSAPSGVTDKALLFSTLNGTKTELRVIFQTGSSILIAVEA